MSVGLVALYPDTVAAWTIGVDGIRVINPHVHLVTLDLV